MLKSCNSGDFDLMCPVRVFKLSNYMKHSNILIHLKKVLGYLAVHKAFPGINRKCAGMSLQKLEFSDFLLIVSGRGS